MTDLKYINYTFVLFNSVRSMAEQTCGLLGEKNQMFWTALVDQLFQKYIICIE